MAIIKLGITVVGIRGTVGGGVFSANKSGPYLKSWVYPIVPETPLELTMRANAASLPTTWRALTQAVRDAWDTLAALSAYQRTNSLGEIYNLSGWGLYTSWMLRRLRVGSPVYTFAPTATIPIPPEDVTLTADLSLNTVDLALTTGNYQNPWRAWVEAQPIRSTAQATYPNRWRWMTIVAITPPATISIRTPYVGVFGPLQTGQAIAIRLFRWHISGPISTPITATATVIP